VGDRGLRTEGGVSGGVRGRPPFRSPALGVRGALCCKNWASRNSSPYSAQRLDLRATISCRISAWTFVLLSMPMCEMVGSSARLILTILP
jgi:disulfide bond formation protein DsbB